MTKFEKSGYKAATPHTVGAVVEQAATPSQRGFWSCQQLENRKSLVQLTSCAIHPVVVENNGVSFRCFKGYDGRKPSVASLVWCPFNDPIEARQRIHDLAYEVTDNKPVTEYPLHIYFDDEAGEIKSGQSSEDIKGYFFESVYEYHRQKTGEVVAVLVLQLEGDKDFLECHLDASGNMLFMMAGGRGIRSKDKEKAHKNAVRICTKYAALMNDTENEEPVVIDIYEGYWVITKDGQRMYKRAYAPDEVPEDVSDCVLDWSKY